MDRKSTKNLRLDRRLADRINWISPAELEKELNALPDVSDKVADPSEEPESSSEGDTVLRDSDTRVSDGSELPETSSTGA